MNVRYISKAIAGGASSALAFAIPVVDDGVKPSEALGIALAFLIGLGITYAAPRNAPRFTAKLVKPGDSSS